MGRTEAYAGAFGPRDLKTAIKSTGESPSETWLNLSCRFSGFLRAAHIRGKTAIKPILECLARKTTAL